MRKKEVETEEEESFDVAQTENEYLPKFMGASQGEAPNVEQAPSKTMQPPPRQQAMSMPSKMPSKRPIQRKGKAQEYQEQSEMKPIFQELNQMPTFEMPLETTSVPNNQTYGNPDIRKGPPAQMQMSQEKMRPFSFPPLPPIINVQNLNELFRNNHQSESLKGFKVSMCVES